MILEISDPEFIAIIIAIIGVLTAFPEFRQSIKIVCDICKYTPKYCIKYWKFYNKFKNVDDKFKKERNDHKESLSIYFRLTDDFFHSIRNDYRVEILKVLKKYSENASSFRALTFWNNYEDITRSEELKKETTELEFAFRVYILDVESLKKRYIHQLDDKYAHKILIILERYTICEHLYNKLIELCAKNITKHIDELREYYRTHPPHIECNIKWE